MGDLDKKIEALRKKPLDIPPLTPEDFAKIAESLKAMEKAKIDKELQKNINPKSVPKHSSITGDYAKLAKDADIGEIMTNKKAGDDFKEQVKKAYGGKIPDISI